MISSILVLVIAFLSLIALMIIHEFGHFIIAKRFGARVDEFGIGYPPRIFGKKIGETIYSINLLPLGAFVKIYGEEGGVDDYRSFAKLKIWQRFLIVIGGVVAFWIVAIILFSIVFAIGTELPISDDQELQGMTNAQVKIVSISNNSPASKAGLRVGDAIIRLQSETGSDITEINKIKEFQNFSKENAGKQITITISRKGEIFNILLSPRQNPPEGEGAVGVGLQRMATLIEKTAWYKAPIRGIIYTWQTTINAMKGLWQMISDLFMRKPMPKEASFAGPLGITIFLANAASYGIGFFLYFIGVISVLVAIFNLFPIPALDGGKLIFLIIEKIKGKPVSVKVEQIITLIFFIILICLSIFITIRFDIPRVVDFFKSSLQR